MTTSQLPTQPRPTDRHVSVLATGSYLPGEPIDNATLATYCGALPDDVLDGIQVQRRHWMLDPATGRHLTSTSAMATAAARQALDRAGVEAAEVDLIVTSTASPDFPLPVMGTYVQEGLGLDTCAVIELRAGCVGAVQGYDLARRLLTDGTYRTALVIGAESVSPLLAPVYLGREPDSVRMRDRLTIYTFGDGAGAMVLRAGEPGSARPSTDMFATASMGGGRKPGMQIIGGGTDVSLAEQATRKRLMDMRIDIPGTSTFGPKVFVDSIHDLLARSGLALDDIDACVLPEGNAEYFASEYGTAGLSDGDRAVLSKSIVENLTDVGATGSAAVPLALDAGWVQGRVRPGDTVLLLAIEASRYLYAGATLTWDADAPTT